MNFKSLGQALDASYFARHSLDFTPDDNQKRVLQSSAHRMILNCTRQWGKSTVCGIKALHLALTIEKTLVIVAGTSRAPNRRIPPQDA